MLPNVFFSEEITVKEFEYYLLTQSILITLLSVPSMIFLREEPPSPPT
jgi:hypothetical protein